MTLLCRASLIRSPNSIFLRSKGRIPSPSFRRLGAAFLGIRLGGTLTVPTSRMSTRSASPDLYERSAKRRRVQGQTPQPQIIQPYGTMDSKLDSGPVQLELTEVESKLRQLLLDVATYIDNSPSEKDAAGFQVPKELADEKIVLRWTGGWVRDKLLQVGSHDIDLAINKMTGEHFGLKMQEYLEIPGNAEKYGLIDKNDKRSGSDKTKKIAPGLHKIEANPEKSKNLETATTKILGIDLDLVNLRKETYNEISRNPEMEFGTAEEDAMRRDATVNAMFFNLHTCEVEDFTQHGHKDMAAKIIRTPLEPYQTFKDDPLRVLRLIRFASRLDYIIEPETAKAMGNAEIQDVLKIKISRERVGIELEKMLRGPRPHMALELIDRFGLYQTVFTDPTRQLPSGPDTAYYKLAYDFVESVISKNGEVPGIITETLLRDEDERYLAWICATAMPWTDAPTVPHPKPLQRPFFTAYLVAREGFKAPNKVCDVIAASLSNTEEIRTLVAQCAKGMRRPDTVNPTNDATARDTLGMAIRRWGSTWRTQVFFNMLYEIVVGRVSKEEILRSYAVFLKRATELDILEVNTFKPLLKGTDLAKALNTKPGPWMKDALDVVMAWQLRNPSATDPTEAIGAVKGSRSEKNESELPCCLASHFLQLTIPPFFPQNKPTSNALETSRQPKPWKEQGSQYVLELLAWSIQTIDQKMLEAQWRFLIPPILKVMDDMDVDYKAKGCSLLRRLLDHMIRLQSLSTSVKKTSSRQDIANFLHRSGYHNVFADAVLPLFAYIPSLTPEEEAVVLFKETLPAITSLALLVPDDDGKKDSRNRLLDKIVRTGILSPLSHFPTPSTYPELATTIVSHVSVLVSHMGIDTVKHLPHLIPLLSAILREPFALSHTEVLITTLHTLRAIMLNAWPRISGHRANVLMGLCLLWKRCMEERGKSGGKDVTEVQSQIKETVAMLDAIMQANDKEGLKETWIKEKTDITEADADTVELFQQEK